jgi:hypothetical protein
VVQLSYLLGGHQMICYGEFFRLVSSSQDHMLQQISNTGGLFPFTGKGNPVLLRFVSVGGSFN